MRLGRYSGFCIFLFLLLLLRCLGRWPLACMFWSFLRLFLRDSCSLCFLGLFCSFTFSCCCTPYGHGAGARSLTRRRCLSVCVTMNAAISNVRRRPLQWRHTIAKGHFRMYAVKVCLRSLEWTECCDQSGIEEKRIQIRKNGSQAELFWFFHRCFVRHRLTIVCWIARFGVVFQMRDFVFGVRARRMFGFTFVHSSYNRSSAANRLKKHEKNTTILRTQWQKVISTSMASFTSFVFEITCVCKFVYLYYAARPHSMLYLFYFYSTLCAHTVVVAVSVFELQIHVASLSATWLLCVCARAHFDERKIEWGHWKIFLRFWFSMLVDAPSCYVRT